MAANDQRRLPNENPPSRRNRSGASSRKRNDSSAARISEIRTAVDILRKVKHKVVGDEFDDESQRKSHEGRLDDHEMRLKQAEDSQVERAKVVARLERWRNEAEAWRADVERRFKKVDKALETPPVRRSSLAFLLSKRALQIVAAVATGLAVFIGTLILTLRGG